MVGPSGNRWHDMGVALSLFRMPSEDVLQPDRIAQELIERQKVLRSIAGERKFMSVPHVF